MSFAFVTEINQNLEAASGFEPLQRSKKTKNTE
jgi:hypothetical protein